MATVEPVTTAQEQPLEKGLKSGALGLISSTVIATASVAPAYSIAATLVFVVLAVGLQAPAVAVLAFVPMLLTSIGYSELNKADPDCGTTFTWATRAFGPRTGWAGGWAIVVADILVMASLAQVASQYVFLLFGATGIGSDPTSGWVLLGGIIWIILMTAICYVGIEVSANFQKILLGIELTMLFVLSIVALVKVGSGTRAARAPDPEHLLAQPVQDLQLQRVRQRDHPDGLHLLGLGHRRRGERGDQGQDQDTRPGRDLLHHHPAGHLRAGDLLHAGVRGRQDHGQRPGQHQQRGRRAVGPGQRHLRHDRLRPGLLPPAAAHGAVLGGRVHPDHDPAHRADHAVDGGLQGAAQVVRDGPPAVHDPHGVHDRDGRGLDRAVRRAELHVQRHRGDRRRGDRDRAVHRVLLRPDRFRLRLVLPQEPDQQHPQPVHAGHLAGQPAR